MESGVAPRFPLLLFVHKARNNFARTCRDHEALYNQNRSLDKELDAVPYVMVDVESDGPIRATTR